VATGIRLTYVAETGQWYLLNGQHRLHAIIQAGIPTALHLQRDAVATMTEANTLYTRLDRNQRRTFADGMVAHDTANRLDLPVDFLRRMAQALAHVQNKFRDTPIAYSANSRRPRFNGLTCWQTWRIDTM
jgi:hypothetical protein